MIPEFPKFKNLELSDKEEIEDLNSQFPPYSDFHFITIYCWDIDNNTLISKLKGNLVIKQIDCMSDEQFYSFLGLNSVPETVEEISAYLNNNSLPLLLRWMPEITVNCLNGLNASITEDRDFFDYIYNVNDIYNSSGRKYSTYRNDISRFVRNYQNISTKIVDINNDMTKNQIINLFQAWARNKEAENKFCENIYEFKALNKLLSSATKFSSLVSVAVFDNDEMIAFIINDLVDFECGCALFWKAKTQYLGIYQFLMQENIKLYHAKGIKLLSFESDLGVETLKKSKLHYHPTTFLKKYKIEIYN